MFLNNWLLKIKYKKQYRDWSRKRKGLPCRDYTRGAGYYFTVGLTGYSPIGQLWTVELESGKMGIYKLVDYKLFHDPDDMIEKSYWEFVGYKDHKAIKDCETFKEFMKEYPSHFHFKKAV